MPPQAFRCRESSVQANESNPGRRAFQIVKTGYQPARISGMCSFFQMDVSGIEEGAEVLLGKDVNFVARSLVMLFRVMVIILLKEVFLSENLFHHHFNDTFLFIE